MNNLRPVLEIPPSNLTNILNLIGFAGIVVLFVITVNAWFKLPDIIPTHFGFDGKPNAWGNKAVIWLFPILSLLMFILFTFMIRFPHTFNYPVRITHKNAFRQYQIAISMLNWLKVEMVWIFVYLEWKIVNLATVENPNLGFWAIPVILMITFGTIGFWLRQSFLAL